MTNTEYNGWTNYATWRVNLEMFDNMEVSDFIGMDAYDIGQQLKAIAEEHLEAQASGLALDYALAFISDVNWQEIGQHVADLLAEEADA